MDTMKDTKMQPATDAVIEELRKMQPTAWVYKDMLGRKYVGFERPLYRRNTHEPLFSAATPAVVMGLVARLEAAEKDVALKEQVIDALGSELNAVAKERDALRNEIAYVKEVEFPRKAQAVADAWKGKCKRLEAERDALRAKIERMEQQEPARLVTATAYRWRYRGAVMWQYGELTEETARRAKEHNHEVQPLYALPGAQTQGEER